MLVHRKTEQSGPLSTLLRFLIRIRLPVYQSGRARLMNAKSSRRTFLKISATAGAAYVFGTPAFAKTVRPSVIVVGAGAFGGWSALQLKQRGAKVTLIDAWGPGNSRASSGGETRTIRATYRSCLHPLHENGRERSAVVARIRATLECSLSSFEVAHCAWPGVMISYESAALPVLKEAGIRFRETLGCGMRESLATDQLRWSALECV